MKKICFLILICFLSLSVVLKGTFQEAKASYPFEVCGEFQGEGALIEGKDKNLLLILDKETTSEVKVHLFLPVQEVKKAIWENFVGTNVKINFEISEKCFYDCVGKLVKIVKRLEPYQEPAIFAFQANRPYKEKQCVQKK